MVEERVRGGVGVRLLRNCHGGGHGCDKAGFKRRAAAIGAGPVNRTARGRGRRPDTGTGCESESGSGPGAGHKEAQRRRGRV